MIVRDYETIIRKDRVELVTTTNRHSGMLYLTNTRLVFEQANNNNNNLERTVALELIQDVNSISEYVLAVSYRSVANSSHIVTDKYELTDKRTKVKNWIYDFERLRGS